MQETDALLLGRYTRSLDRVRPIFSSEGDDEILWRPRRSLCRPLSFVGGSNGIGARLGLVGVMAPGGSGDKDWIVSVVWAMMYVW
jgi:hypothetical protein